MADTVEVASVLPKELRLGVPPKMPQSRSYLFRQQSTLATYQATNTITINIPRLQRSYLRKDSYLRFRVNGLWTPTTATDTLVLDTCGAYGFFDRIEVFDYLGSTVLETISGLPQLSSLLLDLGLKEYIDGNNGGAMAGLAFDYSFAGASGNKPGASSGSVIRQSGVLTNGGNVYPASSGADICYAAGSTAQQPFSREFAISLPSFLGFLSEKWVPLHNGFTIVLTLSNRRTPFFVSQLTNTVITTTEGTPTVAGTTGTTPSYTEPADANLKWAMSDVFLNCQILELGVVADAMMMSSTQGAPMVIHTKALRNYVGNVKGATYTTSVTPTITGTAAPGLTITTGTNDKFYVTTTNGTFLVTLAAGAPYGSAAALATEIQTKMNAATGGGFTVTLVGGAVNIASATPFSLSQYSTQTTLTNLNISTLTSTANTVTTTGQSEFVLNMNLNVASLTDVLWIMRSSSQLDSLLYASSGNRTRNFLQRWQFQYGSTTLPQSNGIQTMASYIPSQVGTDALTTTKTQAYELASLGGLEGYQELFKARPVYLPAFRIPEPCYSWDFKFNANLDPRDTTSRISVLNWNGLLPCAQSPQNLGRFAGGLNLQLANNKEGQIISGLNTNGMNTSIRGIFHPLYTDVMDSVRIDAWAEFDSFVNISPGIASTVSF